jgi:mannosidase alpha-like ER degradation enhancer 1
MRKATRDPFYLRVGERVLGDMKKRTRTRCGFATMRNVETGEVRFSPVLLRKALVAQC